MDAGHLADAPAPTRTSQPSPVVVRVRFAQQPVTGCVFDLAERGGNGLQRVGDVRSNPPGTYQLEVDPEVAFPLDIVVGAKGWMPVRVPVHSRDVRVDIDLPAGGAVRGCFRAGAGTAIENSRVVFAGRTGVTDSCGNVRFDDIAPGRYTTASVFVGGSVRQAACDVSVEGPGHEQTAAFAVTDAVDLAVRVVQATGGQGVPQASVTVWEADGRPPSRAWGTTAEDGRLTLTGLRIGEFWLRASGAHIEPLLLERVRVPQDSSATVVVEVQPYRIHHVAGRLLDPQGRAIAGASVQTPQGAEATDGDGRFSCVIGPDICPPVEPETWVTGLSRACPVSISRGGSNVRAFSLGLDEFHEIVWRDSISLKGGVAATDLCSFSLHQTLPDGEYCSSRVRCGPGTATRRFECSGFSPGESEITVVLDDGRVGKTMAHGRLGSRTVDIGTVTIPAARRIRVSPPADEFSSEVSVGVWLQDSGSIRYSATCTRDTGWLSSGSLPAESARYALWAPGYIACDAGVVSVREGECVVVDAPLRRPADVLVFVRRGANIVSGAKVRVSPESAPPYWEFLRRLSFGPPPLTVARVCPADDMPLSGSTAPDGTARFSRLPPGSVLVTVVDPDDGSVHEVRTETEEGCVSNVDVEVN
jgi:hypothetical protein